MTSLAFVPRNQTTGSADYSATSTPNLGVSSSPNPVGPSDVAANQAKAASMGISIPGVGGGTPANPNQQTPLQDPTAGRNNPGVQGNSAIPTQVQNNATNAGVGSSSLAPVISAPTATPPPVQSKYGTGLAAAQASGQPAPQAAGTARAAVAAYTPQGQQAQDTSAVDSLISSDPGINSLMQGITQLLNPANQTTSLMDDYNSLYKASGLDSINKELIDADTVINGTDGDIRNEIQTAGGFGTESQVQAMSLARNKGLLTRYNQLVQMKTDATNQLNTMVQLDTTDKQMAQTRVNSQIDAMFKLADFRQQAQSNVQEGFNSLVAKVGYAGAYQAYAQSPKQLAAIEQTMGLEPGGLKQLALQPDLDMEAKQAQIESSRASTAASYSTIAKNQQDTIANAQATINAQKGAVNTADVVLGKVKEALGKITGISHGLLSTGLIGGSTSLIPGSPSKNLETTIDTIKSNLAFSQLQQLRASSPTGGALGAISDSEERLLASTVASLDVGQSSAQLQQNLGLVQQHYVSYLNSLGYDYDQKTGAIITP